MTLLLVLGVFMNLICLTSAAPVKPNNQGEKIDILETLQKANSDIAHLLVEGDIVKDQESAAQLTGSSLSGVQLNADPCTATTCKWPKVGDIVPVPVLVSPQFGAAAKSFIWGVLKGFELVTCIRFVDAKRKATEYINIIPDTGCWSYVGYQRNIQPLSLQLNGCVYVPTIQHEILHALGFHHEHTRSDRDQNVTIHYENIISGVENNFNKIQTNNLQTPYNFNSVMQYNNWAFSANGEMTIVANHDPSFVFGSAASMSTNDTLRVNRLYECNSYL